MQAAQVWFDNVQETKINAYKMLYDTLLTLGKPHIKGLDSADSTIVLASIANKSGQFISDVDKSTVYVSKKDPTITKKILATVSQDAKKTISEYYKAAQDLCVAQTAFMQRMREKQEEVKDVNIFLDIVR